MKERETRSYHLVDNKIFVSDHRLATVINQVLKQYLDDRGGPTLFKESEEAVFIVPPSPQGVQNQLDEILCRPQFIQKFRPYLDGDLIEDFNKLAFRTNEMYNRD